MFGKQKILIVDDDENIAELISLYLTKECFDTKLVYDGEDALAAFNSYQPNLILLDLMLPGIDGYQVCREIRSKAATPIIMLSAKSQEMDKISCLMSGADDYITKPFNILEVKARIKAIMRRTAKRKEEPAGSPVLVKGNMKIDCEGRRVFIGEREINLTAKEFDVLELLAMNPNKVYSRENLLNLIWG